MLGRLAMGFANVRAGTRVLTLVLVQAEGEAVAAAAAAAQRWLDFLLEALRSEQSAAEGGAKEGAGGAEAAAAAPGREASASNPYGEKDSDTMWEVLSPRTLSPFYIENTSVHRKGV